MNDEKTMTTVLVLAAVALLGVIAWRRGVFARLFGGVAPTTGGYPQAFPGGLGPKEYGPGGNTFQTACNATLKTGGQVGMVSGDPRLMAGGAVVTTTSPAICAGAEWAATKTVEAIGSVPGAVKGLVSSSGTAVSKWAGGLF